MFAYFLLLLVAVRILEEIFREASNTQYFESFTRFTRLAASTLDPARNLDGAMVTAVSLLIPLLLVLPVAWAHMVTRKVKNESVTQTLIALTVIVAAVILLLEGSLARSFSLVGVVGAVQYRNKLEDPKDALYIFLSIALGMACGLHAYLVAVFLSLAACAMLVMLWAYRTGGKDPESARSPLRVPEQPTLESRLIAAAQRLATGADGRRPNVAITISLKSRAVAALGQVRAELDDHRGRWALVGSDEREGSITLDYLGLLPAKRIPPAPLLKRLRDAGSDVLEVRFHALPELPKTKPIDG